MSLKLIVCLFCRSSSQRLVTLSVMGFTMIGVEDPRYAFDYRVLIY